MINLMPFMFGPFSLSSNACPTCPPVSPQTQPPNIPAPTPHPFSPTPTHPATPTPIPGDRNKGSVDGENAPSSPPKKNSSPQIKSQPRTGRHKSSSVP